MKFRPFKVKTIEFQVGVNVIGQPIFHTHTIFETKRPRVVPADLRTKQLKQTWNVD